MKVFVFIMKYIIIGLTALFLIGCSVDASVDSISDELDSLPSDGINNPPENSVEDPPPSPPVEDVIDEIVELEKLSTWVSSDSLASLSDGDPVGSSNNWSNAASGGYTVTSVGGQGTYYADPLGSGFPSVFICGRNYVADTCVGGSNSRGTQMRLASNFASYDMLLGDDAVPASNTGGGSFTLFALAARVNGNEAPLSYHRDGNAFQGLGVYFGWRNDTTIRFSTQGRNGANAVQATVPAFSGSVMTLITGRFSRTEGLKLYVDGTLVAQDPLATDGVDITSTVIPTLGYRQGNANYGVHLFEWVEVNEAMTDEQICLTHNEMAAAYGLTINDICN